MFLTGTAVEVTPVREIDEHSFEVGQITRQLIGDFDALTREPSAGGLAAKGVAPRLGQPAVPTAAGISNTCPG